MISFWAWDLRVGVLVFSAPPAPAVDVCLVVVLVDYYLNSRFLPRLFGSLGFIFDRTKVHKVHWQFALCIGFRLLKQLPIFLGTSFRTVCLWAINLRRFLLRIKVRVLIGVTAQLRPIAKRLLLLLRLKQGLCLER